MQLTVYISCYVDATNRDAFMAVRQDIMIAFIELVHGKDCELARTRLGVRPAHQCLPLQPACSCGSCCTVQHVLRLSTHLEHQVLIGPEGPPATGTGAEQPESCVPVSVMPARQCSSLAACAEA